MLTGETRLVGLLGNPVSHSLSPRMQNAAFAARGLDWAYVPLPVEPEDLEAAVSGLTALGFAGANVTIPHKSAIVSFCDELDGVAERAASVNTLVVREGRVLGSSTDGLAVTGAVAAEGARVLILGAGGAAVAVAVALLDAGAASVTVAARDSDRAHALAARLLALFPEKEVAAADAWPPQPAGATLLVNATPLCDELPVEPSAGQAVVDLAYRARGGPTALVEAARKAGCDPVVDGREVLLRQGAASFERWTGVTAPVDVMRLAISEGETLPSTRNERSEMLETYSEQQLQPLVGYEVKDSAGEKVGYVDVVFVDDQTGQPEWVGIWNGLPNGHRYLAPLQGITHEGDSVRVPWTKQQIESAPTYDEQDTRGVIIGKGDHFAISAEQEEAAYRHYGLEPPASAQAGTPRLRVWVYEVRAERIRV